MAPINNNLPTLWQGVIYKFLLPLNPDTSIASLLNKLNSKFAQLVSFKRIMIRESSEQKPKTINYYGLDVIPSGGGKDKPLKEIDEYLFCDFKETFKKANSEYLKSKEEAIKEKAGREFKESDKKQFAYIEKSMQEIRDVRMEIGDGTPEGFYDDMKALNDAGFGGAFLKISEFGLYLDSPSSAQQLMLNMLYEAYDGSASLKSTKGEKRSYYVENIPVNCILFSDPSKFAGGKSGQTLNNMLDSGLGRRCFISFMEDTELIITEDPDEQRMNEAIAYNKTHELRDIIFWYFQEIPDNAVYTLDDEAYKRFHKYKNDNKRKYNQILKTSDEVIKKELRGRFWKTLKLAGIIAALEHPKELVITVKDIEYAIYMAELFAKNLEKFLKLAPKTDAEKLYNFFIENKNQWLTKSDINKQKFVAQKDFRRWFEVNYELTREIAVSNGYEIIEKSYGGATNNSGKKYKLIENMNGKSLSEDVADLNEVL